MVAVACGRMSQANTEHIHTPPLPEDAQVHRLATRKSVVDPDTGRFLLTAFLLRSNETRHIRAIKHGEVALDVVRVHDETHGDKHAEIRGLPRKEDDEATAYFLAEQLAQVSQRRWRFGEPLPRE